MTLKHVTNPPQRARSHAQMTGDGSGTAEFNPPHHSIRQREKSGLERFSCECYGTQVAQEATLTK